MRVLLGRVCASSLPIQHCDRFHFISVSTLSCSLDFPGPNSLFTFDTAHPESTIDPITLQKWRKKLKSYYGWSEEILLQHTNLQL